MSWCHLSAIVETRVCYVAISFGRMSGRKCCVNHLHYHLVRGHHNIPNVKTFRVCYRSLSFIPHAELGQKGTLPGTGQDDVRRVSMGNLPAALSAEEEVKPCFKVLTVCFNKSQSVTVCMVREGVVREHASMLESITKGVGDLEISTLKAVTALQESATLVQATCD